MFKQRSQPQYGKGYWAAAGCIVFFACVFFGVSNYSELPNRQFLEETISYSQDISNELYDMEVHFNHYGEIMNGLIATQTPEQVDLLSHDEMLQQLQKQINIMLLQFSEDRRAVMGYFFQLNANKPATDYEVYYNVNTGKKAHISTLMSRVDMENTSKGWNTYYNAFSDTAHMQYMIPLYHGAEYIGFMGVIMDTEYLKELISDNAGKAEFSLLTDTKEVLIHPSYLPGEALSNLYEGKLGVLFADHKEKNAMRIRNNSGKSVLFAYTVLPGGQILLEVQALNVRMARINFLTICAVCIAVLVMTIVQKDYRSGKSTFDSLAEGLISLKGKKLLSEDEENRMKAVIALELGICMMLTFYSLYQAVFLKQIVGFFIGILWSLVIHLFLYKYIKGNVSEAQKFLFVCLMLMIMVIFHIIQGGFGEKGTGAALSWMLGILIFGGFLVKEKWMNHLFGIFVIFLFIDVLLELLVLQNIYYERMFVFVTSLFYAGFALHTGISIYLRDSVAEGEKITLLLEEVRETQTYLIQQEKMAALGKLISGVAHEINTPVGAIKGAAQTMESGLLPMLSLLQRCKEEFEEADYECFFALINMSKNGIRQMKNTIEIRQARKMIGEYLEEIDLPEREEILDMLIGLEITEIDDLIEQGAVLNNPDLCEILRIVSSISGFIVGIQTILFAISRVTRIAFALNSYGYTGISDNVVETDIVKSIENILVLYHNQLKQNIEVIKNYDEDIPKLLGKPDELAQVWTNLIQNAIYAMKEGGKLTIEVKRTDSDWMKVSIQDTGSGIPQSVVERIYDPFFTTKPLGEGSGLGLDISRKVILAHGGTIEVESEIMKGTRFAINLPVQYSKSDDEIKETIG